MRVATLAFWLPVLAYDLHALVLDGWTADSLGTVFWLLYRQALVFLALWAAMAGVQALVLVRSGPLPGAAPKRHALGSDSAVMRFR